MRRLGLRAALLATVLACLPACGDDDDDSSSASGGSAQASSAANYLVYGFAYLLYLLFGGSDKPAEESPDIVLPQVSVGSVSAARIEGTTWDDVLVHEVAWINETTGDIGRAEGTTTWSASIPLAEGDNLISVGARDWADNRSLVSFVVNRAGNVVTRRD